MENVAKFTEIDVIHVDDSIHSIWINIYHIVSLFRDKNSEYCIALTRDPVKKITQLSYNKLIRVYGDGTR